MRVSLTPCILHLVKFFQVRERCCQLQEMTCSRADRTSGPWLSRIVCFSKHEALQKMWNMYLGLYFFYFFIYEKHERLMADKAAESITSLRRYRNLHPTFSKVPALPSLFVYARTYSILKTAANPQDTRNGLCVVVPSDLVLPFYESYCPCSWVGYQGAPTSSHSPNRDSDTSRR